MQPADPGARDARARLPLEAANDDAHGAGAGLRPARAEGWDPFEVWRTRIRDVRRAPDDRSQS